jgi:hypothetical protein
VPTYPGLTYSGSKTNGNMSLFWRSRIIGFDHTKIVNSEMWGFLIWHGRYNTYDNINGYSPGCPQKTEIKKRSPQIIRQRAKIKRSQKMASGTIIVNSPKRRFRSVRNFNINSVPEWKFWHESSQVQSGRYALCAQHWPNALFAKQIFRIFHT